MMSRTLAVIGASSLFIAACSFDETGLGHAGSLDAGVGELASVELGVDVAPLDLPMVQIDGLPEQDAVGLVDLGVDVTPPDTLAPDTTSVGPPCAGNGVVDLEFSPQMVVCRGPTDAVYDQCDAAAICNASGGWHLCSASEYLKRGGKTIDPGNREGWLAGCVRSGGPAHAPTNAVCPSCQAVIGQWGTVEFSCNGYYGYQIRAVYVGLGISSKCRRAGKNDPKHSGYWEAIAAFYSSRNAVCCRP